MYKKIIIILSLLINSLIFSNEINKSYDELIKEGEKYYKENNFIEAEKNFNKALSLMKNEKIENIELGNLYFNIGILYSQTGNYNKAVIFFLLAIENREKNNMYTYDMKKNLAIAYSKKGNYVDADKSFKESIRDAKKNNADKSVLASIYYHYAVVLFDMQKTSEVLRYCELIKRKYNNENFNPELMGSVYNILGLTYFAKHDFKKSIENYKLAIGLLKDDYNNYFIKAKIYENMSKIYSSSNNPESARINLEFSVKYYELSDIKNEQLALNYYNIALSCLKKDNTDKSLINYNKALEIIDELNITGKVAFHTFENTGSLYLKIGKDLDKASYYYHRAEKLIDTKTDSEITAALYSNISVLYYKKKEYETAKEYLNKAINEYKKNKNNEKIQLMKLRLNDINKLLENK